MKRLRIAPNAHQHVNLGPACQPDGGHLEAQKIENFSGHICIDIKANGAGGEIWAQVCNDADGAWPQRARLVYVG